MGERLTVSDLIRNKVAYNYFELFHGLPDGWPADMQQANFEILASIDDTENGSLAGTSVLDVGCGTGDLAPFLKQKGVAEYLGIDVRPDVIVSARNKYPDFAFRQGDFLVEPKEKESFDFVLSSGAITAKIPSGNSEYMQKMVARMLEVSRVGIAFNFIVYSGVSELLAYAYKPEELLAHVDAIANPNAKINYSKYVIPDCPPQMTVFVYNPNQN